MAKLSNKYGLLRTNQIQAFCYWRNDAFNQVSFDPLTFFLGSVYKTALWTMSMSMAYWAWNIIENERIFQFLTSVM